MIAAKARMSVFMAATLHRHAPAVKHPPAEKPAPRWQSTQIITHCMMSSWLDQIAARSGGKLARLHHDPDRLRSRALPRPFLQCRHAPKTSVALAYQNQAASVALNLHSGAAQTDKATRIGATHATETCQQFDARRLFLFFLSAATVRRSVQTGVAFGFGKPSGARNIF
jgi:hypothetical protein